METLSYSLDRYRDPVDWDSLKGNLLFLGHPWRVISLTGLYLLFAIRIGPQIMQQRKAFDLRPLVRVYNFLNVLFNIWLVYKGIVMSDYLRSFFNCNCLNRDPEPYSAIIDLFVLSRVIDYLDTVFFVLRKKHNQISKTHLVHHSSVPLAVTLGASFTMTPFSGFLILLNCMVHVVIYSYYFLAAIPSVAPYLWWKIYITRIQIGQFITATLYFCLGCLLLPKFCGHPPMAAVFGNLLTAIVSLILFSAFYSSTYGSQQKQQTRSKGQ